MKIFNKFDSCISKLENFPKQIERFREAIVKSEEDVFTKTAQKMESIQSQIIGLWYARKSNMFEEIRRFHKDKKDEIEIAKFRFQILSKNLHELSARKRSLAREFQVSLNEKQLVKELVDLEKELLQLENKFNDDFSNINFDSLEVRSLSSLKYRPKSGLVDRF